MQARHSAPSVSPTNARIVARWDTRWIVAGQSRRTKVGEPDAAAMVVDAGLTMSSGDIMMKAMATIEWRLQSRSNVEFRRARTCLECGPSTVVQRTTFATTRPSSQVWQSAMRANFGG
uniref:Uncharacterized protein n=1 Tax=Peronospora matthiolae TaxID=2874970 RepID=A0AAV1U6K9_9STRA